MNLGVASPWMSGQGWSLALHIITHPQATQTISKTVLGCVWLSAGFFYTHRALFSNDYLCSSSH